jgi:hypothetical protein
MIRGDRVVLVVLVAAAATGCTRLGTGDGPSRPQPALQTQYEPLPAAPTAPVTQGALQPLPPLAGAPVDPNAPPPAPGALPPTTPAKPLQTADAGPDKGLSVGRTDLLGSWKMTSSSDSCQLSMSLTTWAGGYRASSRGCTSPDLQKISAWELSGKQVTLKGSDGSVAATLTSAGPERFSGSTSSRQPVALSR